MCRAFLPSFSSNTFFVTQQQHINPCEKKKKRERQPNERQASTMALRSGRVSVSSLVCSCYCCCFCGLRVCVCVDVHVNGRARRRRAASRKTEHTKHPPCTPSSTPYSYGAVVTVQSFTYICTQLTHRVCPPPSRACELQGARAERGGKGDKARRGGHVFVDGIGGAQEGS